MACHGYPYISMLYHGYPWYPMATHDAPWISMVSRGYAWHTMDTTSGENIFVPCHLHSCHDAMVPMLLRYHCVTMHGTTCETTCENILTSFPMLTDSNRHMMFSIVHTAGKMISTANSQLLFLPGRGNKSSIVRQPLFLPRRAKRASFWSRSFFGLWPPDLALPTHVLRIRNKPRNALERSHQLAPDWQKVGQQIMRPHSVPPNFPLGHRHTLLVFRLSIHSDKAQHVLFVIFLAQLIPRKIVHPQCGLFLLHR